MEMVITFPGGRYMEGRYKDYTVRMGPSDKEWWEGPVPGAFDLFVMSLALCTSSVIWAFVDNRDLSIEGTTIILRTTVDRDVHMITDVDIILNMPRSFPTKYREAIARAAEACAVKKHIVHSPRFRTEVNIEAGL
jgi:putative redox protein